MESSLLHYRTARLAILTIFGISLTIPAIALESRTGEIGRVIRVNGITSAKLESGEKMEIRTARPVYKGSTIIAYNEALIELLLADGTRISIYGPSMIKIESCRTAQELPPTLIRVPYGKLRLDSKSVHNSMSLILLTPSCEIRAVRSEFAMITSTDETKTAVFKYKLAVASSEITVKTAFVVYPGEEISVRKGAAPMEPIIIGSSASVWWTERYYLTSSEKKISGYEINEGAADWLIRERNR